MTAGPSWVQEAARQESEDFSLHVNGEARTVTCRPGVPLLYVLRGQLGLTGTRFGCGLGQCGACTVLLDGQPAASCDLPVWSAAGHEVTTVEGLSDGGRPSPVQEAFLAEQAAQCGYCMSGLVVAATALLAESPDPAEEEIRQRLDGHLCRCGSHQRVIRAVRRAAEQVS
jgi:nicotinate dehydrogenase subunit A